MVFITGPRQVGKTYLAMQIMQEFKKPQYLNYDILEDLRIIKQQTWKLDADILVFDEIHKMKNWKMFLKGVYDGKPKSQSILVTGSARMDTFRQSGESLAGRYFHHRLFPLSVKEVGKRMPAIDALNKLNIIGGFPEPFLDESDNPEEYVLRWRNQYYTDLIREDILEFSRINELKAMRHLVELLRTRVGSPLSYKGIAEDLQISPNTVKKYVQILESLHILFLIRPFHKNIARAILKEPKIYFYDSGFVKGNEGLRLENTCALSLLKHVNYLNEVRGQDIKINYIRNRDAKEVDFLLVKEDQPHTLIEVKLSDFKIAHNLIYFKTKFPTVNAIQVVHNLRQERVEKNIEVLRAADWLKNLSA